MGLVEFLEQLHRTGEVTVTGSEGLRPEDRAGCEAVLRDMDRVARLSLPGKAPALDMPAATWAAALFYRGCQFLLFRDIPAEAVSAAFKAPGPQGTGTAPSASLAYSADLVLHHLPQLLALARGLAPDDPLVSGLKAMALQWPLSSVGVPDLGPVSVYGFFDDPCLRQAYVDRILKRKDASRAADPRVAAWIRCSVGFYASQLCPQFVALLEKESP